MTTPHLPTTAGIKAYIDFPDPPADNQPRYSNGDRQPCPRPSSTEPAYVGKAIRAGLTDSGMQCSRADVISTVASAFSPRCNQADVLAVSGVAPVSGCGVQFSQANVCQRAAAFLV